MPAIGLFLVRALAAAEGLCRCCARPMTSAPRGRCGPGGIHGSLLTDCLQASLLWAGAQGKDMQLTLLLLQCGIYVSSEAPGSWYCFHYCAAAYSSRQRAALHAFPRE